MKKNMMFASCILIFSGFAWALPNRSVSIPVPDGKLVLTNPTSATVNYTVECFSTAGASVSTKNSESLAAGASTTYNSPGLCANGAAPAKKVGTKLFCSGAVNWASRESVCDTTTSAVCTLSDVQAMNGGTDFLYGYWIAVDSSNSASWYSSYDAWTSSNVQDAAHASKPYGPITANKGTNYRCGLNSTGTGTSVSYCQAGYGASAQSGTMCCATGSAFASCKVTLVSPAQSAHLQSPQFKGSSPF